MKPLFYHILLTAIYFRVLNSFWTCEFTNLPLGEHISISIGPSVWIYHRSITANITLYALLTYTGLIRFSVHLAFWVCSPVSSKSPWKRWGSSEMIKAVQMIVSPSVLLVPSQVDIVPELSAILDMIQSMISRKKCIFSWVAVVHGGCGFLLGEIGF